MEKGRACRQGGSDDLWPSDLWLALRGGPIHPTCAAVVCPPSPGILPACPAVVRPLPSPAILPACTAVAGPSLEVEMQAKCHREAPYSSVKRGMSSKPPARVHHTILQPHVALTSKFKLVTVR